MEEKGRNLNPLFKCLLAYFMQNHSSDMPLPREICLFYSLVLQETQSQ